jgi:hypothetical protein
MSEEEEETFWSKFELDVGPDETKELVYEQEGDDCLLINVKLIEGSKATLFIRCKDFKDESSIDDAKLITIKNEIATLSNVGDEKEVDQFLPFAMKPALIVEGKGKIRVTGIFAEKGMIQPNDEEEEYFTDEEEEEEEQEEKKETTKAK